ncbi:methyltransferase [Pigmentiphaga litoralis]|uniref:class I SAM-dependent methyltransferase n=1 Tax=Pigmentiphaga litoralis TaxID=516702 RepID=UPI001677A44B|nr:SAM-dependent methyltransferase [Pigmentiphaga litoralis]GGX35456.1 methyltransferase [Pigmentiphaga litoralis]
MTATSPTPSRTEARDASEARDDANRQPVDDFLALARQALADGTVVTLVLAGYRGDGDLKRVQARAVVLKDLPMLSLLYRHATKDITKNFPVEEGLQTLRALLGSDFRNAQLTTRTQDIQLAFSKKGKATLRVGKAQQTGAGAAEGENTEPSTTGHNREKHRYLDLDRPFLVELGVTDRDHKLVPAMSRKWKQINKFIEVFAAALSASPAAASREGSGPIRVADFGSGKGYLTFAIHDYLQGVLGRPTQVTGVELRQELVDLCNGAIERLGLQGLNFDAGDVRSYAPQPLDVMIALHACDIATDYAIHMGIRAGASVIMCSPCCHKEVRPQLLSPHPLRPILQHGVHLGQEAEMLTDGIRALLLDAAGYDTQVFEFISLEHTNKNKMILAVKRATPKPPEPVLAQIDEIKRFYGIKAQCLETLLKADALV